MANDIEINVRVSNQTGAGLTAVNASMNRLRQSARDASRSVAELRASLSRTAALDVSLDDRTEHGATAIQARVAELRAIGPIRLRVDFHGDAAQIVATAGAMRGLRTDASRVNTALTSLTPRALAAAAALEVLKAAAQDASHALRTLRGRTAATSVAMHDLRTTTLGAANQLRTFSTRVSGADSRLETLTTRTTSLRTQMDDLDGSLRRVGGSMTGVRGSLGSLGSASGNAANGQRKLLMAAIALAPALIPITAAVAPLVPALGAAGAAMGAFGAALLPQILNIGKLGAAQKAHKQAVEESGRTSKEAAKAEAAWLREIQKASPEVRKAAASLGVMKEQYKGWTDSLAGDTLPVATKSFAVLGALFPKMTPLVKGASAELSRLMDILAVGVQSKGFDDFMVKLTDLSRRTLREAVDGAVRLGQAMSRGIQSDDFREFLAYVRESGPIVGETLGNLARALMKLVAAAADTGIGILTVVNAFAQLINALPTDLLAALLQMAFAFKAVQLAAVGFSVVGPAMLVAAAGIRDFIRAARFAGVASAISGVVQQLTMMQKASIVIAVIVGLAVAVNELAEKARGAPPDVDRLTTSLKQLATAGKFGGELRKTFGDIDGLVSKIRELETETKKAGEAAKGAFGFKIPVLDDIGNWGGAKFAEMWRGDKSLRALKDDFKALDEAMSNLATSGHADLAAESFGRITDAAQKQGISIEQVKQLLPQYGDAIASLEADQQVAARSMGLFGEQAVAVQAKLDAQKASTDGLRQSIQALNDVNRQALGGMIGFEAAIDAAATAASENAGQLQMVNGALDLGGEKARTAASALADLADKTDGAAAAARENGASWTTIGGIYERGRQQLMANAEQMGLTREQARQLTDQILAIPAEKTTWVRGNLEDLQAKLASARQQLASVPDSRRAQVLANIADLERKVEQARRELGSLRDRTVFVRTHYQNFTSQHTGGQAQAHGGIIGAAGGGPRSRMTLVGEQGPELVDLAPGSRVRSNPDSKRIAAGMAGGGGGGPIVVQVMLDGRQVAEAILNPLRSEIFTRGGNVQSVLGQAGA